MNFNLLVEEALNEHGDIYTADEITISGFSAWEASVKKMNIIQRYLKKKGYYKMGIRGLIPDIEPRNEIEQKAKEMLKEDPNLGFYELQSVLSRWIAADLSPERKSELYNEYKKKGFRSPLIVAVKILFFGLIVIPYKKSESKKEYWQRQELMDKLVVGLKNAGTWPRHYVNLHLKKDLEELGITQFKVYKEYSLDKETEQDWGGIIDEL